MEAAKMATKLTPQFCIALQHSGWQLDPIKLSAREKNGYILLPE